MNTFKELIENTLENTYRTINVPLYSVTKNTGKFEIIKNASIYGMLRDNSIRIYGNGKTFRFENIVDYNNNVAKRIQYGGLYGQIPIVTHYLYINEIEAKNKALEILYNRRDKINKQISEIIYEKRKNV